MAGFGPDLGCSPSMSLQSNQCYGDIDLVEVLHRRIDHVIRPDSIQSGIGVTGFHLVSSEKIWLKLQVSTSQ